MLTNHVSRYLSIRRVLGFELKDTERHLRTFAVFADSRGEAHIRTQTVVEWAGKAPSVHARSVWFRDVLLFARFVHAEDPCHEVPATSPFHHHRTRPLPYIYSPIEIESIVTHASLLSPSYPLRPLVYSTLFGLLAVTSLRISEALRLTVDDIRPEGYLFVCRSKFGKSRCVPLHPTAVQALAEYVEQRRRVAGADDSLFVSSKHGRLPYSTVHRTFRAVLSAAGISNGEGRRPRIHDLRHTTATRALEHCPRDRESISCHMVALATYLGHSDIANTYWYLETTAQLLTDIALSAESTMHGGEV